VDGAVPHALALITGGFTAVLGTAGDPPLADRCADGQVLVGFHGATGTYGASVQVVGQIVGHCSTLRIGAAVAGGYAVTAEPGVLLTARGADTANHWSSLCGDNQVAIGLAVRAGSALDQIAVQCAPLTLVAQDGVWSTQVGAITVSPAGGGTGGAAMTARCPDNQVATVSAPKVMPATTTNLALLGGIGVQCSVVHAE
jgi:hypothetical protein